ncbi:hypothetical protein ABFP60_20685 [Clostridioides difficile]
MDIIEIIAKALESISLKGITVVQGWYDENINDTHITFCELSDRSNNISDDEEEDIVHILQIDIWSKKDEWKLKKEVKKLMLNNDFGYIEGQDFFEPDTKIYHKSLRFNYLEEVN